MNLSFQWGDRVNDEQVQSITNSIVDKSIALAKSRGLGNRYIYQNYGYINQDVFDGYGEESKRRLVDVQQEYDPDRVFVDLQPGYFKLRP